jgi:hypothetical protein
MPGVERLRAHHEPPLWATAPVLPPAVTDVPTALEEPAVVFVATPAVPVVAVVAVVVAAGWSAMT